jgi:hypothetical protein
MWKLYGNKHSLVNKMEILWKTTGFSKFMWKLYGNKHILVNLCGNSIENHRF